MTSPERRPPLSGVPLPGAGPNPPAAGCQPSPTASRQPPALKDCAVLVGILEHGGEECVLLTKRPETLTRYAGQVSFPGGERDPEDADLSATAIREAREEVGIAAERITLLAELPWRSTTIGHRVRPYLARVAPGPIEPDPREVERVLYLPISLLKPDPFRTRVWTDPEGRQRSTWSFLFDGLEIWGLTARILREHFAGAGPES